MLLALEANNVTESTDVPVESETDATLTLREGEVCIGMGNDTRVFVINTLKQLPYFAAFFSGRWLKDRNDRSCKKISLFDNANGVNFKLDDLVLLLKCIEMNCIPSNVVLNLQQLESLVNCADFFCSSQNDRQHSVINQGEVVRYLQCRVPAITAAQRKEWVVECENKMVRKALHHYNEILEKQFCMARRNTLLNTSKNKDESKTNDDLKNLTSITFDSDTAATLFKEKFKIIYEENDATKQLNIKIRDYNKQLWHHLCGLFSITDYWHYFGKDIATLVDKLCGLPNRTLCLTCEEEEGKSLHCILHDVLRFLLLEKSTKNKNPNISSEVTFYSLLVAQFKMVHARGQYYCAINQTVGFFIMFLTEKQCEQFISMFISTKKVYVQGCDSDESKNKACQSWFILFQKLLRHCGANFLASNAELWFPIGHQGVIKYEKYITKDSWNNTIFNDIIPKFNTQLSFNFGLYLADFMVYCDKQQGKPNFDDRYSQFLKNSVGITWNLV